MNIDWNILRPVDIGEHFQQGFQTARDARDRSDMKNALAGLANDPNDANALSALTQVNPEMGMQYRQQQSALVEKQGSERAKMFGIAAKNARTPEQWNATVDYLAANGHPDAAKLRDQFQLRSVFMAQGGVEDDADAKPPATVQAFQFRQGLPADQQGQFDQFQRNSRPQIFGSAEAGYNVFDPSQTGATATVPRVTDQATYDAIPPGATYETPDGATRVKPGGQASASDNFPDPLSPQ